VRQLLATTTIFMMCCGCAWGEEVETEDAPGMNAPTVVQLTADPTVTWDKPKPEKEEPRYLAIRVAHDADGKKTFALSDLVGGYASRSATSTVDLLRLVIEMLELEPISMWDAMDFATDENCTVSCPMRSHMWSLPLEPK